MIAPEIEKLASELYEQYCLDVVGKGFTEDALLPSWETLRKDPSKQQQVYAWYGVAELAALQWKNLHDALAHRNEVEGKAHALFTEPLSNGQTFTHLPDQCNPLGFVQVMRAAVEKLLRGEQLPKPFILMPK